MASERRGWRDHPLVQLTLVRYREFFREPEAVFWVFVFPVLLTAGLGLAFRNQAPERTPVAVVEGEGARRVQETLAHSADVRAEVLSDTAAAQALRTGRVEIVVVPGAGGPPMAAPPRGSCRAILPCRRRTTARCRRRRTARTRADRGRARSRST